MRGMVFTRQKKIERQEGNDPGPKPGDKSQADAQAGQPKSVGISCPPGTKKDERETDGRQQQTWRQLRERVGSAGVLLIRHKHSKWLTEKGLPLTVSHQYQFEAY